jgi:hypothetical protein
MSNPLNSSVVSDPSFTLQPAARAAGPPDRATPRQYRRDLRGRASEQLLMEPPAVVFLGYGQRKYRDCERRGIGQDRHLSPLSSDGGPWTGSQQNLIPPAPQAIVPDAGRSGGVSTVGLRGGQTLATWIGPGAAIRRSLTVTGACGQEPKSESGTGLAREPASKFVRKGRFA